MPTYREDLHLGHEVPLVETDDLIDGAITERKMADDAVSTRVIQDGAVTEPKLADDSVSTRTIQDGAVTEPKLADNSVSNRTIQPEAIDGSKIKPGSIENKHLADDSVWTRNIKDGSVKAVKLGDDVQSSIVFPITDSLDQKYTNITEELYSMIASLQVGGVALSQQFGDRTDIGISQKTLTKMFGSIMDILGDVLGKDFMNFKLTVQPLAAFKEGTADLTVTADSTGSISDFDSVKVYVDDDLVCESSDIVKYITTVSIDKASTIKVVGVILGKTIIKEQSVKVMFPFFMGSGYEYTDVLEPEYQKELDGSLEGEYDIEVRKRGETDERIYVIIPISRKEEFRRCKMDMNGYEIPFNVTEMVDFIVCESLNTYQEGIYNLDIDINS